MIEKIKEAKEKTHENTFVDIRLDATHYFTDPHKSHDFPRASTLLKGKTVTSEQYIKILEQLEKALNFATDRFTNRKGKFKFPRLIGWIRIFRYARKWCNDTIEIFEK